MKKNEVYHYYVEGHDEKKIVDILKRDMGCIKSGKVDIFNAVQNRFSEARIRTLKSGTIVVLIYDTDVESNITIMNENIIFLKKQPCVKKVLCIPQVKNLEDELINACNIKSISELTKSKSDINYKRDLINCSNLDARLKQNNFQISKLWNRKPDNKFQKFGNDAEQIKIK